MHVNISYVTNEECSNAFKRFGRAMLRPLFDQVGTKDGTVDAELVAALEWWYKILELNICELRPWEIRRIKLQHVL